MLYFFWQLWTIKALPGVGGGPALKVKTTRIFICTLPLDAAKMWSAHHGLIKPFGIRHLQKKIILIKWVLKYLFGSKLGLLGRRLEQRAVKFNSICCANKQELVKLFFITLSMKVKWNVYIGEQSVEHRLGRFQLSN